MKLTEIIQTPVDKLAFPETNRRDVMRCAHQAIAWAELRRTSESYRHDFDDFETEDGAKILSPVVEAHGGRLRFGYAVERDEPGGSVRTDVDVHYYSYGTRRILEIETVYEPSTHEGASVS